MSCFKLRAFMRSMRVYRQSGHLSGGVIQASFYIVMHSVDEQSIGLLVHLKLDKNQNNTGCPLYILRYFLRAFGNL